MRQTVLVSETLGFDIPLSDKVTFERASEEIKQEEIKFIAQRNFELDRMEYRDD